jgi:hypothetical protein
MTRPDSARPWNVQQGVGTIQWGMSDDEIRNALPLAEPLERYHGRNPKTGEEFVTPPGLVIPSFCRLDCGVTVTAVTESDERGVAIISLNPSQAPDLQTVDGPIWPHIPVETVNTARREVAARLGVGPIDESLLDQSWTVGGCQMTLSNEWDDFVFEVHRPESL